MDKKLKVVLSTPLLFAKVFKKTKIDNFVGGLIIGAIFSLVINIITVRTHEVITKQRALEAIEREISLHFTSASSILNSAQRVVTASSKSTINIDGDMAIRFSTKVWDNTEVYKYIFEIDPDTSALIDGYYGVVVPYTNRLLEENYSIYKTIYEPCKPFYELISGKKPQSNENCLEIIKGSMSLQARVLNLLVEKQPELRKKFHPTRDRLNSFWLRLLLGDKAVNLLR